MDKNEEDTKRYSRPHFIGSRTSAEVESEREKADPLVFYYDIRAEKSREMLIFMEETKIWQDKLLDCDRKSGVNAIKECKQLFDLVQERVAYYNSNYNKNLRPKKTPGLPLHFERGSGISVWELKREIIVAKRMGKAQDFDLLLLNALNNEELVDDQTIVERNAQVVVRRVPIFSGRRLINSINASASAASFKPFVKESDDGKSSTTKSQSSMGSKRIYRPQRPGILHPVPPDTYVCYRCGVKGHFIQHCPTNADPAYDKTRVKRTTGIPKSFLKPVSAPNDSGVSEEIQNMMITPEGSYVVAEPNEREWKRIESEKNRLKTLAKNIPIEEIPKDLLCPLCNGIFSSPVMVPCCQQSFCDDCITRMFEDLQSSGLSSLSCPSCSFKPLLQSKISADNNKRRQVMEFLNSQGQDKSDNKISNNIHSLSADLVESLKKQGSSRKRSRSPSKHD